MTPLPTLDVVVPVHDERERLPDMLRALRAALDGSPWRGARVLVVDDGSGDGSAELLDSLAPDLGLDVLHQANSGRLAARAAGLRASSADLALLVDARVTVHPGALAYLAEELAAQPEARIWNGDVTVDTQGNPYAAFWSALTTLGWRRYFANRRRMSYGPDEFDLYPKGTTFFVAPRAWLLEESDGLDTHFRDRRFSSDDTALIRALVQRGAIHMSPEFACTYNGRDALVPFLRHAFFRGTTFVDSYLGRGGSVGRVAGACAALAPVLGVAAWRRPRVGVAAAAAGAAGLGLASRCAGAPRRDAAALAALLPVFASAFGAGFARGLVLAGAAVRRRAA